MELRISKFRSQFLISQAVSLQVAAKESEQFLFNYIGDLEVFELPIPMMNILNGGSLCR